MCSGTSPDRPARTSPTRSPGWTTRTRRRVRRREHFEAWKQGRTGYPDRRRRHAPAARRRLDAQPGADDRRLVPGQGSAHLVAAPARGGSWSTWSTATWRPTTTAGSGWPAPAPTRRPTSGSSTRCCRARSSTPTATTSGATSPSSWRRRVAGQGHPLAVDGAGRTSAGLPGADRRPCRRAQGGAGALRARPPRQALTRLPAQRHRSRIGLVTTNSQGFDTEGR